MENQTIIGILVTSAIIMLLCRLIFFKKKVDTTIEVDNCEGCPFKYKKDGMLIYNCKAQEIIYADCKDFPEGCSNYKTLEEMKDGCPIDGKLDIVIKERK